MTHPNLDGLEAIVKRFEVATPAMLGERRLLRRVDTKFILPVHSLIWILNSVARDYRVLDSDGSPLARYRTIYLDTPDLRCFHDHRCGRRPRHKVRIRRYLDRRETFFEIKTKRPNDQTVKHRLPLGDSDVGRDTYRLDDGARRLVALYTSLPFEELAPTMVVDYYRMTLLAVRDRERTTIDVGLDFDGSTPEANLDDVAILEVKQPCLRRHTPIMQALRAHRFYPGRGSKYCTTMVMARPDMRANRVRDALREVERIQL